MMKPFTHWYLTPRQLAGFDRYTYKSVDTSPLATYLMHPFWNQIVKIYPLWLSPNLITFIGWMFTVSNFAILAYFDWDFTPHHSNSNGLLKVPSYIWVFCAVSQFLSHTLDGTDGKQARRTQSSSPLGELFDHGLDSTAIWMMSLSILHCYGTEYHSSAVIFTGYVVCLVAFFLAHFEKYNTSVLYLPWAYDFSQVALVGVYLITFWYSPDFWTLKVYGDWRLSNIVIAMVHFSLWGLGIPVTLWHIVRARLKHPEFCPTIIEGMMPLVPLGSLIAIFVIWSWYSPSDILKLHPRAFCFAFGNLFSNITCRLIVAQMSSSKCDRFNWMLIPLVAVVVASLSGICSESKLLYGFAVFSVLAHSHYAVSIVNQLCDHLNIRCFVLPKAKLDMAKADTPKAKLEKPKVEANGH